MAKFSEKELPNIPQELGNPWSTSSAYINLGSLGKVISLAERTGQLQMMTREARRDEIRDKANKISPSLKLIKALAELADLQTSLNKIKIQIHYHQLEKETVDITNPDMLEQRTRKMEELSVHLSALVNKKDELISRLQKPFVGDYLSIDVEYHRYVAETIPAMGEMLSNLKNHMECIAWSAKFSLEDGEMEKILGRVSSALAQMQSFFQSLTQSRNLMGKLLDEDIPRTPT